VTPVASWDCGTASIPCLGEVLNGDRAFIAAGPGRWLALLVDGCGHGRAAAAIGARIAASGVFQPDVGLGPLLEALHALLAGTVGAAALAAEVVWVTEATARLSYTGVGNVQVWVRSQDPLVDEGRPGLLGSRFPSLRVHHVPLALGDRLALVTDGIRREGRHALEQPRANAHQIATQVVHQYGRSHDDATCVALQMRRPP
jgi:hypothetical protein